MGRVRHSVKAIREFGPLPEGKKQVVRIDVVEPRLRSYQYRDKIRFRAEVCAFSKRFAKNLDEYPCDIEAQRDAARRFALEVRGGDTAQGGSMKVRDFFWQVYLPDVRAEIKTARDKELRFKRFLDGYMGDRRLDQVTTSFLDGLPKALLAKGYSNRTVNHFLSDVRTLFNKVVKKRRLNQSPARFLENLKVIKEPVIPELTVDRLAEFVTACMQDESPVFADLGVVMIGTGLRVTECRTIKVRQLDKDITSISIPTNKANRPFYAPVNSTVREAIKRRLVALGISGSESRMRRGNEYLFQSPVKASAPVAYPREFFARVSERLGAKVRPHDCRRLWGTAMTQCTGNIDLTSRALNHSDIAVTQGYVNYAPPELMRASELTEQYLIAA